MDGESPEESGRARAPRTFFGTVKHGFLRATRPAPVQTMLRAALQAAPYALVLGLGLGLAVMVGANLSNANPSEAKPWGYKGPSNFSNGVAMNRPSYVLAATVPSLLLGIAALRGRTTSTTSAFAVCGIAATQMTLLWSAALLGARIGSEAASRTFNEAFWAFVVAHALLACVFYAVGVAAVAALGRVGPAIAGAVWIGYVALYEQWTRWKVLRQVGYAGISSGALPNWFYVAQALSPLTAYRALLITWHPGFRDWEEKAVLGKAALPAWMTPMVLGLLMAVWIMLLLDIAVIAWALRTKIAQRARIPHHRPQPYAAAGGGK